MMVSVSCMVLLLFFIPVQGNNLSSQGQILMKLYNATNGDDWEKNSEDLNWGMGDPCLDGWIQVQCDDDENVTGLDLCTFIKSNSFQYKLY